MSLRSYDRLRLTLATSGLLVAGYLTLLHYDRHVPLACSRGSFVNCENVLTSPSATVLGVPVAVWGLVWFAIAVSFAIRSLSDWGQRESAAVQRAALAWMLVGTGVVLWLIYQELAVIGRVCVWCTGVHILVLALLVVEVRRHGLNGWNGDKRTCNG